MSKVTIAGDANGTGVFTIAAPNGNTNRTLTLPDEAGTIALAQSLSYVRLNTANGYGSTNNKIRRFTNIVNNAGSDITYADSATLGATFTINVSGVYSAHSVEQYATADWFGLSINSTQLTTHINSITAADRLASVFSHTGGGSSEVSATFYAAATSVVRVHTGGAASSAGAIPTFHIARVA